MNQQRSRRFRTAQEAKEKEEARKESIALWECESFSQPHGMIYRKHWTFSAMGQTVSDDERQKMPWDSNAITPGTPFMDLLATSLRYWVVRKMNTDPAWRNVRYLAAIVILLPF